MKDKKLIYAAITLYAAACAILFGALMAISYAPPAQNGAMLGNWIIGTLGMVLGHIVTVLTPGGAGPQADTPPITPSASSSTIARLPTGISGYSRLGMLLAVIAVAVSGLFIGGCASLQEAGHTAYNLEPVLGADGKATSCKFSSTDGKEYASRSIAVNVGADGCTAIVKEGASSAFQGQAIAEKGLSILPSFAPALLPPGPASAPILPAMQ